MKLVNAKVLLIFRGGNMAADFFWLTRGNMPGQNTIIIGVEEVRGKQ